MARTKSDSRSVLNVVDWRLYETLQAFEVLRMLNDRLRTRLFQESINNSAGFWQPVTVGLQTTFILGVYSLLDQGSTKSATLYTLRHQLCEAGNTAVNTVFWNELDEIRGRYERARHKLFGHNDPKRDDEVLNFESLGLTWLSVANDLATLRQAVKSLAALVAGKELPTHAELCSSLHEHDLAVVRTLRDTTNVLDILSASAAR